MVKGLPSSSQSDNLLADLVRNRSLTYGGLSIILRAIKSGEFNSKDVTLDEAEDVLLRQVNKRYDSLVRSEGTSNVGVPYVVMQGVIDVLSGTIRYSELRKAKFIVDTFDTFENVLHEEGSVTAKATLRNMSLVHSTWTLMAYRALGENMIVPPEKVDGRDSLWDKTFKNPLYGRWTRAVQFSHKYQISEFDAKQRTFYISKLALRFTHLRELTVTFSHFTDDLSEMLGLLVLSTLTLEKITFSRASAMPIGRQTGVIEIPDSVFQNISRLPHLRSLRTAYSGSNIRGMDVPAQLEPLIANPSVQELQVDFRTSLIPHAGDISALLNVTNMLWRRVDAEEFTLEGLRYSDLRGWGRQSLVRQAQQRQKVDRLANFKRLVERLTMLDVGSLRVWEVDEYETTHCKRLRELSAHLMEPRDVIDDFLNSVPRSIEILTFSFPSTTDVSVVDKALGARIMSGVLPNLKKVRLLRLHRDRDLFNGTRILGRLESAPHIPFLSKICEEKGVDFAVAQ
ncbi:hypothetical protein SCHPADRAFT_929560 [Schizopora paradoxa]|uniref:Uncharacterized protein n=1 Tax=Schizopora paradoxa TaxID=27342 RepID=A0A0H2RJF4_9AGAM|nr:hypothetical protein SCHPADRAFT_929560 [Schizopora paradoxa]